MNINFIIAFNFVIIIILLLYTIYLTIKVRRMEEKLTDVSAADIATFVEQMQEMVIESERVADRLDTQIRERESTLEDLADLVEKRIDGLNKLTLYQAEASLNDTDLNSTYTNVFKLMNAGDDSKQIARNLGISVTEAELAINLLKNTKSKK